MKADPQLVQAVVTQVLIPEILGIIRAHHASTGELPTDEQVIAKMNTDADAIVAKGEAFLNR